MAEYKIAISKVLKNEGGYANDPTDRGGETYRGISRNNWPKWLGWKFIDVAKKYPNFPDSLYSNSALNDSVMAFYRDNFWNKISGNDIKNQDIANLIVDSAVLEGISAGIKHAQLVVGLEPTGRIDKLLITKLNSL